MRTLVLKDHAIDKDECLALLDEFSEFFEQHTGIKPEWYVEGYDFSRVPTVPDSDGDLKPTAQYRKDIETEVHKRYGDYGVDNIIMLVHEKHFTFSGIWGSNWSYNFYKYSFQLCRWDKDNSANTFGTLYHELMHSFDTLVRKEVGGDPLNQILETDWDAMVHGASPYKYIGRRTGKENTDALELAAPYLIDAFQTRKEKHFEPVKRVQKLLISLLQRILGRI